MGYATRENLWFGTEQRMGWFRTPLRGADASPEGWAEGGTLLNGGGYQFTSWGSHKNYQFEWGAATPTKYAQTLKSYADGTYGRGLIYFYDPLIYGRNVMPARWADPGMALGYEGSGLVYGVEPVAVPLPSGSLDLPVTAAQYDLTNVAAGFRGKEDALFLPVPTGYTLLLGSFHTSTGTGGIYVTEQNADGTLGATTPLTAKTAFDSTVVDQGFYDVAGVWVWAGKSAVGAASVTVQALIGRLLETQFVEYTDLGYGLEEYGETPYGGTPTADLVRTLAGPWEGGLGHSGVRFNGKPTYEITGPFNGGQVGFAASFREVGSFAY